MLPSTAMTPAFLKRIVVFPSVLDRRRGRLVAGSIVVPCALGRTGRTHAKREGDGATPVGSFALGWVFYRADRIPRPRSGLPLRATRKADGWCDDPGDRRYNRCVTLPIRASHETLWRQDRVYDIVADIAWNRGPIRRGRGSAIFLHLARPGFEPTAGCVAVDRAAIARILATMGPRTRIVIRG